MLPWFRQAQQGRGIVATMSQATAGSVQIVPRPISNIDLALASSKIVISIPLTSEPAFKICRVSLERPVADLNNLFSYFGALAFNVASHLVSRVPNLTDVWFLNANTLVLYFLDGTSDNCMVQAIQQAFREPIPGLGLFEAI